MNRCLYILPVFLLLFVRGNAEPDNAAVIVPGGFRVTQFAGDDLAHDIWCMTLDSGDRVCVGGPGYIKFLIDSDGDGMADVAKLFTDKVRKGPMGLLVDGDRILSVESNAVVAYRDKDGDLQADGDPEILIEFTGKGGEHGPHGIRKGPDGWYYVVCGNNTGVNETHASMPGSPVKNPNQGCIIRISPNGLGSEVVGHGFRNPYDIAFSDEGRLFTYDSDNERDHHLPWYADTRVFDVAFGRHHGWLNPGHIQSYNTPEYYTIDRMVETGRGSPTGVEYYWHHAFPENYRKGLFFACWTFGRIYFAPLEWESEDGLLQERKLRKQDAEVFAKAGPEGGFAPVDLALDSRGSLWVACGGRNTSGKVFQITPPGGPGEKKQRTLSLPQMMVGRNVMKPVLQHPHTVRTFLDDPEDLHLVYQAFQESHGGINHRPEPRSIDAGYCFSFLPTGESRKLRDTIAAESGAGLLLDMDLKAEDALTGDAAAFAEYWKETEKFRPIEPWRDRNYRELARTLGCVKTEFSPVLENLTMALREDTHPTDDVHYLFCLAQIPAPRTSIATWRIASAFLRVDAKLAAIPGAYPSRNWPRRLKDLFKAHCELDSNLAREVMWSHSLFGSSVHHARYIETIDDPKLRKEVITKMYQRLRNSKAEWTIPWTGLVVSSLSPLPVEEVRELWDNQIKVRHILASELIDEADPVIDAGRLFEALALPDPKSAARAAGILASARLSLNQAETEQALSALVRHQKRPETRETLLKLLRGKDLLDALATGKERFPESSVISRLAGSSNLEAFTDRLSGIDWEKGDAASGKALFVRLRCSVCHSGQNRLGPGLKGVSARFGRNDFFLHTAFPNLAISDLYKAVQVSTREGKTHIGVPVYSSPDQTLLETGPGQTINLSEGDILSSERVSFSPMPEGLLLNADDQDFSDLWAYIKSL